MIFHDSFASAISSYDPTGSLSLSDIRTAIRNANGAKPSLFVPEMSFELLAKQQIANLEPPSLFCVSMVYEELLKLITSCASAELARYPNLQKKVIDVASTLIKERMEPTRAMVQSLIAIELAYINTNHPDFCRAGAALAAMEQANEIRKPISVSEPAQMEDICTSQTGGSLTSSSQTALTPSNSGILNFFFRTASLPINSQSQSLGTSSPMETPIRGGMAFALPSTLSPSMSPASLPPALRAMAPEPSTTTAPHRPKLFSLESKGFTEKEEMETHLIMTLIRSYFNVVRKNIVDLVPKATMHFLVNAVKENLHNRLVTELYRSDSEKIFDELLQEDPAIVKERRRISQMLETLSHGMEILGEIGEMATE
ncbi:hypothetical protein DI09_1p310 [Mitosporidium daphniae]|uniref:GED domain-containing protein n=1 Tax=Mitosporidium daphniae TaxID=1485682 RepID=A0A098VWP8_9MICR|nr:uncharacterized protein DI09_1p310 [Mitosporidium daphniae]KGG52181.1 hypothetical protein DI09_1p310 [Mitosporidium daphniae]|eukprot:XP_013238608.1 uncharacterized protein DI09_1p310 [Mitosporidium daphniae]